MLVAESRKSSLFLICYHLPITFLKDPTTGKWTGKWQNSLLAKTSGSVADAVPTHWIGGVRLSHLPPSEKTEIKQLCNQMNAHPIFVTNELHEKHYLGMCKQVLWPSFHNIDMLDLSTSRFSNTLEMAGEAKGGEGIIKKDTTFLNTLTNSNSLRSPLVRSRRLGRIRKTVHLGPIPPPRRILVLLQGSEPPLQRGRLPPHEVR